MVELGVLADPGEAEGESAALASMARAIRNNLVVQQQQEVEEWG